MSSVFSVVKKNMPNLHVALAHYPVVNKEGSVIASALTNLDLHDIARAARTYGLKSFFVVTPLEDQKLLAKKIIAHWTDGFGAAYNPQRRSALELIRIRDSLATVCDEVAAEQNAYPLTVATCARKYARSISYEKLRTMLDNGRAYVLILGTAWGLAEEYISRADYVLDPISGNTDYNHLSVRCAAAIMFDRLLGNV